MRGRKRQRKKDMKKWIVKEDYSFWDLLVDSKRVFEILLHRIRIDYQKIKAKRVP